MNESRKVTWEEAVKWLISQPDQQELVKACYYDEPRMTAALRFYKGEEWQAVLSILRRWIPGRVLDLGAGHGISAFAFAHSGCSVVAVDSDSSPFVGLQAIGQLAQEANLRIDLVQTVAEEIPFKRAAFDIVYGRQVLHHAADLKALCRESARVMRPGGVFLATREHIVSKREDLSSFLESHPLHWLYGGENAFLLEEYRAAILEAGLSLIRAYGPYETVINHFPMTCSQYQMRIHGLLQGFLGKRFAQSVAGQDWIRALMGRYDTRKDRTPGRLYSFVAVK